MKMKKEQSPNNLPEKHITKEECISTAVSLFLVQRKK